MTTEVRATTSAARNERLRPALFAALLVLPGAPRFYSVLPPPRAAVACQEAVRGEGPGFRWEAAPGLAPVARRFAAEVGGILEEARRWTGLPPDERPVDLVWVATRADLARALGEEEVPAWFAAVAVPRERHLIIATEIAGTGDRLRTTLRHELMHLAMADMGPGPYERLPAWFHEGCAEVFAGDVYLGGQGVSLAWRALLGDLESLADYEQGFGRESFRAAVGYALGQAFVARLRRVYGQRIVPALLARIASGETLDQALIAETGLSEVTHELKLRQELASPLALLSDFYPQLFLGVALLLVFAFPFVWLRRRRRRRELEERWGRQEQQDRRAQEEAARSGPQEVGGDEPEPLDWWRPQP